MEDRGESNFDHEFEVRESIGQNGQEEGYLKMVTNVLIEPRPVTSTLTSIRSFVAKLKRESSWNIHPNLDEK
jgi:hypothetical protein